MDELCWAAAPHTASGRTRPPSCMQSSHGQTRLQDGMQCRHGLLLALGPCAVMNNAVALQGAAGRLNPIPHAAIESVGPQELHKQH